MRLDSPFDEPKQEHFAILVPVALSLPYRPKVGP